MGASYGDDFLSHKVESDDFRLQIIVEMNMDSVANPGVRMAQVVSFGED